MPYPTGPARHALMRRLLYRACVASTCMPSCVASAYMPSCVPSTHDLGHRLEQHNRSCNSDATQRTHALALSLPYSPDATLTDSAADAMAAVPTALRGGTLIHMHHKANQQASNIRGRPLYGAALYTGQPSIRDRPFTRFPALPFRTRALRQGRGVPPRCHAGSIASQFRVIIRALLFRTRALSSCLFPQPMSRVQPKSWILALTKLQVLPVPRVDVASQGVDVSLERVRLHQGYRFLFRV